MSANQEEMPRCEDDARSPVDLFAASLKGDYEDEAAWDAVRILRRQGTPEVFELAVQHCRSADPKARARGLDVLAQLGAGKRDPERPYLRTCVETAIEHLADQDPLVVHSAAWALAHLGGEKAVAALIPMKTSPDPGIRHAVACGMPTCPTDPAKATLMHLMDDESDEVRDWATFGLGSLCVDLKSGQYQDSPEIRSALHARLNDPAARDEAIWGLAQRRDPVGLKILLARLELESCMPGDKQAAEEALHIRGSSVEKLREDLRQLIQKEDKPLT